MPLYTKLLSLLTFIFFSTTLPAQTNIASYQFSRSIDTYTPITNDTAIFSGSYSGVVSGAINLGGIFTFGGVAFSNCYVSSNGYITFGTGAPAVSNIVPLYTEEPNISGVISAYGVSGNSSQAAGANPRVSYVKQGSEFIIQYRDHITYSNRNTDRLNFQIRLNLANNTIKIVYGICTQIGTSAGDAESQVGIRGNTNNTRNNVNNLYLPNYPAGTSCSWADAVTGYTNTNKLIFSPSSLYANIKIPEGLTYNWVPASSPEPVKIFAVLSNLTGYSARINWAAPTGATQYNVQYRVMGDCNWTNFSGNPISSLPLDLNGLTPGTVYQIRVQALNSNGASSWSYVPDLSTNSDGSNGFGLYGSFKTSIMCAAPTNVLISSITTNSANVSFAAFGNSFIAEYGPAGFTPGTGVTAGGGIVVNTTTNTATLNGLASGIAYDVYVRQNCTAVGNGYSANTTKSTFTTMSAPCSDTTVPYTENFDAVTAPATPRCVTIDDVSGGSRWQVATQTFPGSTAPNIIRYIFDGATSANDWFFTRGLNLEGGTAYRLKFKYLSSVPYNNQLEVRVGTTATPAAATSGQQIFSNPIINENQVQDASAVFTPAASGVYYFGFHTSFPAAAQLILSIDNIDIRKVAECLTPTAVNVDSVSASAARVSFIDTGSSYIVEYGLTGFTPGTGATAGVNARALVATSSPFVLTGLNNGRVYDLYVRMRCNASGTLYSPNSTKFTFTTPCAVGDVPYSENFDTYTAPTLSTCIVIKNVNGGNTWQLVNNASSYIFSAPNTMKYVQNSSVQANDWFFVKGLNLTAGGSYKISFKTQAQALEIRAAGAPTDSAALAGPQVFNYSNGNVLSGNASAFFSPVVSGVYYFGFRVYSVAGYSDTYVDDIDISLNSTCALAQDASISAVTTTSAQVLFQPTADSVLVEYGLSGFTPGLAALAGTGGTIIRALNSPVLLSGLAPNQLYKVYMRRSCATSGNGYSFNRLVDSFYTAPANDLPTGAITLQLGAGCTGATYSNIGATKLTNEPGIACSGTQTAGKSVWFKFVAPASGFVKISTDANTNTLTDTKMALYAVTDPSNYSTFQIIGCDDDNGVLSNGASILYATGLTAGQTYYVVVDDYNGTATGNFCLRVDEVTPSMMATSGSCTQGQTVPEFRADYKGWASLTNNNGELIANVRSNTTLSSIVSYNPYVTINTGGVRQSASGEYYLDRNFRIANALVGNYDVQFFLLNTELTALQTAVPAATLANLNVTKVKGETACQPAFVSGGTGNDTLLLQTASGTANGISWITVNINGFSNFYIHSGSTQLSRLYVFNGNGAWSNPANWLNGELPPAQLPSHCAIEIRPAAGGQCIMDLPQHVPAGSTFRVQSGTNIVVPGLIITQ